jgi:hypothetical protein
MHNLTRGMGLELELRNGKKLFLGTQRQDVLEKALRDLNLVKS